MLFRPSNRVEGIQHGTLFFMLLCISPPPFFFTKKEGLYFEMRFIKKHPATMLLIIIFIWYTVAVTKIALRMTNEAKKIIPKNHLILTHHRC